MELFRQLDEGQMDRQTDRWTLLVPKVAIATEKWSKNDEIKTKNYERGAQTQL